MRREGVVACGKGVPTRDGVSEREADLRSGFGTNGWESGGMSVVQMWDKLVGYHESCSRDDGGQRERFKIRARRSV